MDPISIAMALSQFVPQIVKWVGGDKAGKVAEKVIDVAKQVTGKPTGDEALKALQADPSLVLKYREAVLAQETELNALAVQNAGDVNATMRAEAAAEHWPTYSWRPAIGFAVAIVTLLCGLTVFIAYIGAMFYSNAAPLAHLPGMLGAMAALVGVVSPILGIASWFRGKAQADPNVPTVNRG